MHIHTSTCRGYEPCPGSLLSLTHCGGYPAYSSVCTSWIPSRQLSMLTAIPRRHRRQFSSYWTRWNSCVSFKLKPGWVMPCTVKLIWVVISLGSYSSLYLARTICNVVPSTKTALVHGRYFESIAWLTKTEISITAPQVLSCLPVSGSENLVKLFGPWRHTQEYAHTIITVPRITVHVCRHPVANILGDKK